VVQRLTQAPLQLCSLQFNLFSGIGEHRFPRNVGPEKLRPTKAWEIHPIKMLADR